jgi:hydroxymethylglutaryl-CoA reductase
MNVRRKRANAQDMPIPMSRPKLRDLPLDQRLAALSLSDDEQRIVRAGLAPETASHMVENAIGTFALPLGVAENFVINGRDVLVPMVVEEPSVIAACSFAAKLARACGGFAAGSSEPIMIGQIQILDVPDAAAARAAVEGATVALVRWLNSENPTTLSKHAFCTGMEVRAVADMMVVHVMYHCGDAMGANLINTACEALAPRVEALTGGRVNLRILSNYSTQRMAKAECTIPASQLGANGASLVERIIEAGRFAELDPYRAVTHNKGVMNGIDAVLIATGNDWRAVEAAAHAWAARDGRYASMTRWTVLSNGDLHGDLELPMAVGTVGGATRVHPTAQIALKLMGVTSARQLAEIVVCVGLAQNFAAIRALAAEGIQQGHMSLHARQIALAAGATGDAVDRIAAQLIHEGRIRLERAKELVTEAAHPNATTRR